MTESLIQKFKKPNKNIKMTYKNCKGLVSERKVLPLEIVFTSNQWHKEKQWLMRGIDLDKQAERMFALKNILDWEPV